MAKLRLFKEYKKEGSVLIDVLIALLIMIISLVIVFTNISSVTKKASVTKNRVLQLIETRNTYAEEKKITF